MPWSLPLKLVLGAVLGVLGGAGVLGALSEYATYSYAIYFGFRPPLEGIPYLKATVAFGSFALLVTGALVFVLSTMVVKFLVWSVEWIAAALFSVLRRTPISQVLSTRLDFAHVTARLRARPVWQVLLLAVAVAVLAAPIAYFEAKFMNRISANPLPPLPFAAAMGIASFIVATTLASEKAIWWLAWTATLIYFGGWLVVLFSPYQYSGFLRIVGYGGGIPVVLELENGSSNDPSREQYFLLLRTSEAFLLFSESRTEIVELPRDEVKRISHARGGLRSLPFQLP